MVNISQWKICLRAARSSGTFRPKQCGLRKKENVKSLSIFDSVSLWRCSKPSPGLYTKFSISSTTVFITHYLLLLSNDGLDDASRKCLEKVVLFAMLAEYTSAEVLSVNVSDKLYFTFLFTLFVRYPESIIATKSHSIQNRFRWYILKISTYFENDGWK